jgi:hypothetical protein
MRRIGVIGGFLLGVALVLGWGAWGGAGAQRPVPVKQYTGQIQSVKIDRCGMQPGTCEGSVVLKLSGGQTVTLAILPGTWLQRGDRLVLIDELGVGNYVTAQATPLPEQVVREGTVGSSIGERAIMLHETGGGN